MTTLRALVPLCTLLLLTAAGSCTRKNLSDEAIELSPDFTEINKNSVIDAYASIAPLRVEAEDYSAMKGVMIEDCREGGENVGYISIGDWMEYSVDIAAPGTHTINIRTAGPAGTVAIQDGDNNELTRIDFSATPSGQIYATTSGEVLLKAGKQTLRVVAVTRAWNFNWFELINNASGDVSEEQGPSKGNNNNLLLEASFEDEKELKKWDKEVCRSNSLTISEAVPPRKGNSSARFELAKSDVLDYDGYVRAEIRQKSEADFERWYGFSNFLPNDFVADPLAEKIAQWHDVPDFILGENWRSPPISFGIENDRYYVNIIWASGIVNTILSKTGEKRFDMGPVDKNKWNDWVFHIKFSYKDDGILEIWKNRVRVLSWYGPNSYNDKSLPYFKIGIYKWGWDGWAIFSPASKRTIYYDEVRIGNKNANVPEVSPR